MIVKTPFEIWLDKPMGGQKGLHQDIFTAAAFLLEEGWSEADAFQLLRQGLGEVDERAIPDRELNGAIDYARRKLAGEIPSTGLSPWPPRNETIRAEIIRVHAADMNKLKSGRLSGHPLFFLRQLYRPDDLVCIGRSAFDFLTVRLCDIPDENRDLPDCEFITPSPMSAMAGLTVDGTNYSPHAKSNTGPRVYSVIEFDDGRPFEHASILKYLATFLPLVMIVYSGKTSLHGWFACPGLSAADVQAFYATAIEAGADPKMHSVSQFSRLPGGRNPKTQRRQTVLFFNPRFAYFHAQP